MTKAELKAKLEAAIGGTPYGDAVIADLVDNYVEGPDKPKYYYTPKDRLDSRLGFLKGYERVHRADGKEAMATAEADKIAIVEKALKAIEG